MDITVYEGCEEDNRVMFKKSFEDTYLSLQKSQMSEYLLREGEHVGQSLLKYTLHHVFKLPEFAQTTTQKVVGTHLKEFI